MSDLVVGLVVVNVALATIAVVVNLTAFIILPRRKPPLLPIHSMARHLERVHDRPT